MSSQKVSPQENEICSDQLIELYLSKPLEEQDAVEGTRFKTKIFIETALIGRGNDLARNDKLRLF
jgi:hypothetical protein